MRSCVSRLIGLRAPAASLGGDKRHCKTARSQALRDAVRRLEASWRDSLRESRPVSKPTPPPPSLKWRSSHGAHFKRTSRPQHAQAHFRSLASALVLALTLALSANWSCDLVRRLGRWLLLLLLLCVCESRIVAQTLCAPLLALGHLLARSCAPRAQLDGRRCRRSGEIGPVGSLTCLLLRLRQSDLAR